MDQEIIYIGVAESKNKQNYCFIKVSDTEDNLLQWLQNLNNKFDQLSPYILKGIKKIKNGNNIKYTEFRLWGVYENFKTSEYLNEINLPAKDVLDHLSILEIPKINQTGIVYILLNESYDNLIKIGITSNIKKRIKELSSASGVPTPFKCLYAMQASNTLEIEQKILKVFQRPNAKREFVKTQINLPYLLQFHEIKEVTPHNIDRSIKVSETKTLDTSIKKYPTPIPSSNLFKELDIPYNSLLKLNTRLPVLFSDNRESLRRLIHYGAIRNYKAGRNVSSKTKINMKKNTLSSREETFESKFDSLVTVKTKDMRSSVIFDEIVYDISVVTLKLSDISLIPRCFLNSSDFRIANILLLWSYKNQTLFERGLKMGLTYFRHLKEDLPHIYNKT